MALWDYTYRRSGAGITSSGGIAGRRIVDSESQMIEKAKMLASRLPNILTYLKHRITNAASESINSKDPMDQVHRTGLFATFGNFATAIYFHCGGWSWYPHPLNSQ